jgi:hypothetical protein
MPPSNDGRDPAESRTSAAPALRQSLRPATTLDTGGQIFMGGQQYYRQINDLAIMLCASKSITDAHWLEFLEKSVNLSNMLGHNASVTMTGFLHAHPNAVQRSMTNDFLKRHRVPVSVRLGLVSDSSLVRGAIVALNWIMPDAKVRSFAPRDFVACLTWLHEVGKFDLPFAIAAWGEANGAVSYR